MPKAPLTIKKKHLKYQPHNFLFPYIFLKFKNHYPLLYRYCIFFGPYPNDGLKVWLPYLCYKSICFKLQYKHICVFRPSAQLGTNLWIPLVRRSMILSQLFVYIKICRIYCWDMGCCPAHVRTGLDGSLCIIIKFRL